MAFYADNKAWLIGTYQALETEIAGASVPVSDSLLLKIETIEKVSVCLLDWQRHTTNRLRLAARIDAGEVSPDTLNDAVAKRDQLVVAIKLCELKVNFYKLAYSEL